MDRLKNFHKVFFAAGFVAAAVLFSIFMMSEQFATVSSQNNLTVENNTDRPGGDYQNFDLSEAKYQLCQNACANESNCLAYTYVRPGIQGNNARCWLKNKVPAAGKSSCCVSGVKSGSGSVAVSIAGRWSSHHGSVYNISQNGSTFTWLVENNSERGEGKINGKSVSAKWDGGGSATGTVTKVDSSGRATRIEWSNGAVFTRD